MNEDEEIEYLKEKLAEALQRQLDLQAQIDNADVAFVGVTNRLLQWEAIGDAIQVLANGTLDVPDAIEQLARRVREIQNMPQ